MDNLEELKQINDDLPFTKFPDEIDEYTPFSDVDDNINNMITRYRTLLKQGNTTEANTIYQEYNLGSYIIGAKFLNKIQHMIIACERAISSVKKYFTFSIDEPDGSIAQPNGYIWGKIISAQAGFKNVLLKLKESGSYRDIYPITTIDNVWQYEKSGVTETLTDVIQDIKDTHDLDVKNLDNNKMDKNNPTGTGSLTLNRLESNEVGENAVVLGSDCSATGKGSFACGRNTIASNNYSSAFGYKTYANDVGSFVIGKYNDYGTNGVFCIGNGTSDEDRKNIFNIDWDGNVEGNSFTASDDIIYNNGKSLINLNNTVSNLSDTSSAHTTSINNLNSKASQINGNYVITSIRMESAQTDDTVAYGEDTEIGLIYDSLQSGEYAICVPYAMNKYTCIDDVSCTNTSQGLIVNLKLSNVSVSQVAHTLIARYYLIKYKKIS